MAGCLQWQLEGFGEAASYWFDFSMDGSRLLVKDNEGKAWLLDR
ncbi:MAG: hypothetical protein R3F46_03490 [bacterium]